MCPILITFIIISWIIQNINRMRNHIKRQELRVSIGNKYPVCMLRLYCRKGALEERNVSKGLSQSCV